MIAFLNVTKGNKRLKDVKIKRLYKADCFIFKLFKDSNNILNCYNNPSLFLKELALDMNQNKDSKTIVFTWKMFMWFWRIVLKDTVLFLKEISLPQDSRLERLTNNINFEEKTFK